MSASETPYSVALMIVSLPGGGASRNLRIVSNRYSNLSLKKGVSVYSFLAPFKTTGSPVRRGKVMAPGHAMETHVPRGSPERLIYG